MANGEGLNIIDNQKYTLKSGEGKKKVVSRLVLQSKRDMQHLEIWNKYKSAGLKDMHLVIKETGFKTKQNKTKTYQNHLQLCLKNHEELRRYQRIRKKQLRYQSSKM